MDYRLLSLSVFAVAKGYASQVLWDNWEFTRTHPEVKERLHTLVRNCAKSTDIKELDAFFEPHKDKIAEFEPLLMTTKRDVELIHDALFSSVSYLGAYYGELTDTSEMNAAESLFAERYPVHKGIIWSGLSKASRVVKTGHVFLKPMEVLGEPEGKASAFYKKIYWHFKASTPLVPVAMTGDAGVELAAAAGKGAESVPAAAGGAGVSLVTMLATAGEPKLVKPDVPVESFKPAVPEVVVSDVAAASSTNPVVAKAVDAEPPVAAGGAGDSGVPPLVALGLRPGDVTRALGAFSRRGVFLGKNITTYRDALTASGVIKAPKPLVMGAALEAFSLTPSSHYAASVAQQGPETSGANLRRRRGAS